MRTPNKKSGDQTVVVVVVTERRWVLKVLMTLLGAVGSGIAGRLVDQFWARPVPVPQVLTPAPVAVAVTPTTGRLVFNSIAVPWESTAGV